MPARACSGTGTGTIWVCRLAITQTKVICALMPANNCHEDVILLRYTRQGGICNRQSGICNRQCVSDDSVNQVPNYCIHWHACSRAFTNSIEAEKRGGCRQLQIAECWQVKKYRPVGSVHGSSMWRYLTCMDESATEIPGENRSRCYCAG